LDNHIQSRRKGKKIMLQKSVRDVFFFLLFFTIISGCGLSESTDTNIDPMEGVTEQAVYTGPSLKMPLPAGYNWDLTTIVNDSEDQYHTDVYNGYWSLDFSHLVRNNNGSIINVDNTSDGGVIDILAAAKGTVIQVTNSGCVRYGITCKVLIDHEGSGYYSQYLHFQNGSIIVSVGEPVEQGQVLGKMGNTGASYGSTGIHLHFQMFYSTSSILKSNGNLLNGQSYSTTQELVGLKLEGQPFINYDYGFHNSTNSFTYNSVKTYGANPRTCSNGLGGSPISCNQQNRFNLYRHVFSDVLVESIQRDVCFKSEVWVSGVKRQDIPEYCTNGIQPGTALYFNNVDYFTTIPGAGEVRYFSREKNSGSYLSAPFAVTQFTVIDSNTPTSQPPPVITAPADWTIIPAPSATLSWADASPWQTQDHDLYFWYWNGSTWVGLGWINGWVDQNILIGVPNGLPAYRWLAWAVRSCNSSNGCSDFSNPGYFALSP
jgi:Peptidase family M23